MKCQNCQTENTKTFRFCNNCGSQLYTEPVDNYDVSLTKTKIFFFTLLGYIALLNVVEFKSSYTTSLIVDLIFALIVVTFFIINYKNLIGILIPKDLNYNNGFPSK